MNNSSYPIARDIQLLYELSLSLGRTLELDSCCNDFLSVLLARKNISYAAVWIQGHLLLGGESPDEARLVFALPRARACETSLPVSHPALGLHQEQFYRRISWEDPRYQSQICERSLEKGTLAVLRLGDLGWLRLLSLDSSSLSDRELLKLRNVVEKFTTTIQAALLHQRIVHEISERKRSEEERAYLERQVQHAQKLESLGVLAGGIAHDFNNLLVGILGNAEIALSLLPGSMPAAESIHSIINASEKAAGLCRQMLAYSGKASYVVRPMDLGDMLLEILALMKVAISKKITIQDRLETGIPQVSVDATQMHQVTMNLITNASEAIGDRAGTITLSTGMLELSTEDLAHLQPGTDISAGTYEYFEISDDGCGMDGETCSKIFDPFYSTKFTGRGLGLAAVLGIVRGHGGAIGVESRPEEGTTIRVFLPVKDGKRPTEQEPLAVGVTEPSESKATILVVDDEEIVLGVAKAILQRGGYEVLGALGGTQALDFFHRDQSRINLLIVDLTMPDISGYDVFTRIREVRQDIPILLCSGYDEHDTMRKFTGHNLTGFIHKPYSARQLLDKTRAALDMQDENIRERPQSLGD